ncbi:hypothetical protein HYV11_03060 [Candidatus Dependentiae bacterium]|nr:hypothetical protein [Candidatus Dependentiae bacterium]
MRFLYLSLCIVFEFFIIKAETVNVLEKENIPGTAVRLKVMTVENETDSLEFKVFTGYKPMLGLLLPMSTLHIIDQDQNTGIALSQRDPFMISCSKGSFRPVFIQDGSRVSGKIEDGYDGPYVVSMWLSFPYIADSSKIHVPYLVKKGEIGKIGVKIGQQGDYRLKALSDTIKFLPLNEIVVDGQGDQD